MPRMLKEDGGVSGSTKDTRKSMVSTRKDGSNASELHGPDRHSDVFKRAAWRG